MSNDEIIRGKLYFDPEDPIFQSHFPSFPVVPGSLIVGHCLQIIQNSVHINQQPIIQTFNFLGFIVPGSCDYTFEITASRVKCKIFQKEKLKAKGVISYEA